MSFTTQSFLYLFLPLCLGGYYLLLLLEKNSSIKTLSLKFRLKDLILIAFSLGFYMWACFDDVFRFLLYIVLVYLAGRLIEKRKGQKFILVQINENGDAVQSGSETEERRIISRAFPVLCLAVAGIVFCLIYYKYTDLLTDIWNYLFRREYVAQSYLAPVGISFITFSAVSYMVDVYRGDADAGNFLDCLLYLSFFPKVVSGPVVLWKDFRKQISTRVCSLDLCVNGINRIMIGFAKKLILADQFGALIDQIPVAEGTMDPVTALGMMFAYMLQLYFDFSGYSDIAIGLSGLFGFTFKENFRFPYCSCSIGEFWRRWHISLGTWFREYVYIPLGGSRTGMARTLRNLAIVFLLTGIWHGAGWNYLLWGGINGLFVIIERLVKDRPVYRKTPSLMKWFFTMLITLTAWQFFRFTSMDEVAICFGSLFGKYDLTDLGYTWKYYFDTRAVFLLFAGTIGATVFQWKPLQTYVKKMTAFPLGYLVQELILIMLFSFAILCMVNSTYSPFIYFQY